MTGRNRLTNSCQAPASPVSTQARTKSSELTALQSTRVDGLYQTDFLNRSFGGGLNVLKSPEGPVAELLTGHLRLRSITRYRTHVTGASLRTGSSLRYIPGP